jgi:hypothetical protein
MQITILLTTVTERETKPKQIEREKIKREKLELIQQNLSGKLSIYANL